MNIFGTGILVGVTGKSGLFHFLSMLSVRGTGGRAGRWYKSTSQFLAQLAVHGLPDFTLAYFPDNDFDSHSEGPKRAWETVRRVDSYLAEVAQTWGGVDGMLDY